MQRSTVRRMLSIASHEQRQTTWAREILMLNLPPVVERPPELPASTYLKTSALLQSEDISAVSVLALL